MEQITVAQPAYALPTYAGSDATPSQARPSDAELERAMAALASTNEGMRHRAADCKLPDIAALTRLLSVQLARIGSGALALSADRVARLTRGSALIAQQLDAHFDGHVTSAAANGQIRAILESASVVIAQDSAVARRARPKRGIYLSVKAKFRIAIVGALAWMLLSTVLAQPWLEALSESIGMLPAVFAITGIAIIPGFMNAFLLVGLAMDRRPAHAPLNHYPPLSILIAAYDEAQSIEETVRSIALQNYPGKLDVIVVDDGSADGTGAVVQALIAEFDWLTLVRLPNNGGKAKALNHALQRVKASLVVTVDADSYLYHEALQNIVQRYFEDPRNTRAVAGTVLVRNSRTSWITKAQEWDYFHGISAIKRVQSLFQGTLVAQGAFSLYDRATLVDVGGWPDCVGEDIVLTWAILKQGFRIGHSEEAYLFTNAPATLGQFVRQRQRWSRGMIEGFKQHPDIMTKAQLCTFFVYWNLLFPLLDLAFTICFIPGIVFALFGHYDIVGPMTLALLPMGLAMNLVMYSIGNKSFKHMHLRVRRNLPGFFIYTLLYSLIMQPACLVGYASELLGTKKTWGTK
jgi:biofilm PGA synthesis N-glycosyltransferase PgaC